MKKNKRENLVGVPPEELFIVNSNIPDFRDSFILYKSSKKEQNSFRITKSLLESLIETSLKIQKKPILVITIVDGSDEYTVTSSITKK